MRETRKSFDRLFGTRGGKPEGLWVGTLRAPVHQEFQVSFRKQRNPIASCKAFGLRLLVQWTLSTHTPKGPKIEINQDLPSPSGIENFKRD